LRPQEDSLPQFHERETVEESHCSREEVGTISHSQDRNPCRDPPRHFSKRKRRRGGVYPDEGFDGKKSRPGLGRRKEGFMGRRSDQRHGPIRADGSSTSEKPERILKLFLICTKKKTHRGGGSGDSSGRQQRKLRPAPFLKLYTTTTQGKMKGGLQRTKADLRKKFVARIKGKKKKPE